MSRIRGFQEPPGRSTLVAKNTIPTPRESGMLAKLGRAWSKWREHSRRHAIDRALYRAGGGRHHREAGAHGTAGSAGAGGSYGGGGDGGGGGAGG